MDWKDINMQCIKEYKPQTTIQYEQIHYNEKYKNAKELR